MSFILKRLALIVVVVFPLASQRAAAQVDVDIELVALSLAGPADVAAILPLSDTNFSDGDTFFLEVWARTADPNGLSQISTDLHFDQTIMSAVSVTHTSLFNIFTGGCCTINNVTGLVDNLSGSSPPAVGCAPPVGFNEWVRVAIVEMTADAVGIGSVQSAATEDPIFELALCGTFTTPTPNYGGLSVSICAVGGSPCPGPPSNLTTTDLNTSLTPAILAGLLGGQLSKSAPTISNVVYTGANNAAGRFTGDAGILGFFSSGVVLSTGDIASVVGPNTLDNTTTNNGTPGDSDLDFMTGGPSFDAAALEFDFACFAGAGAIISLDYVFASEEYNEFVGSAFNNAFAIYLNGVNIAVLPDTITPVSANTLNCGNPYNPPSGGPNCDLFVNNDCSDIGPGTFPCSANRNTEMDGLSAPMTADGLLNAGTNHLKIVIANNAGAVVDANVFLLARSLQCTLPCVGGVRDECDSPCTGAGACPCVPLVPNSLKSIPDRLPLNLVEYIKDMDAAVALGKAFFWDMQTGGDGLQACGTCHYHAGVDARTRNTLHPGFNGTFDVGGPNYTLQASDFPFASVPDPVQADDIVGSAGVVRTNFSNINLGNATDSGTLLPDAVNNVTGLNTRQVTGRNTPSFHNAIFNVRVFWDGRANYVFNGVNPFGLRDPNNPTVLEVQPNGTLLPVSVTIEQAALASQAVGPANNNVEMSWDGRTFKELGRKLLSLRPLAKQIVDPTDSVLGGMVHASGKGLAVLYSTMIQDAFQDKWWNSPNLAPNGFSVMESNFSLFWGLAINTYGATQRSDDAPFDQFREGNLNALTSQQKDGLEMFMDQGKCILCHGFPEFTNAGITQILGVGRFEQEILEPMIMGDCAFAVYDSAFYNIGVRPSHNDVGVGGTDPFGNPLSFVELARQGFVIGPPTTFTPFIDPAQRTAVTGSFKVPSLRNIELTAPYMHNGGMDSLEEVLEFYTRGGDFADLNIDDLDPFIRTLPFSAQDRTAIVAFLKSLTDERVRIEAAPFDHPQIFLPHGHIGDDLVVFDDGSGAAIDCMVDIAATGAAGGPPLGTTSLLCVPVCGNGFIETGEQCDDGNTAGGDCCSSTCQFDPLNTLCIDDGSVCTLNVCDGSSNCLAINLSGSCDDGVSCTAGGSCVSGVCQAGAPLCTDLCQECDAGSDSCNWCVFDHNLNGFIDGIDFGFFSGCFGACYAVGHPCRAASYDNDPSGCVGTGDFAGFSGCFAKDCANCTNCFPGGAAAALAFEDPSATSIEASVRLVATATPVEGDRADVLPASTATYGLRDRFDLEIWASRGEVGKIADDGLAAVFVDLGYDPLILEVEQIVASETFELLSGGLVDRISGAVRAVGGCVPLGDAALGVDGAWVRVATLKMTVIATGETSLLTGPAGDAFGISIMDRFGNLDASRVEFGQTGLSLRSEVSAPMRKERRSDRERPADR